MDLFKEFINAYGTTILYTLVTAIFGYIGIAIKRLYTKYVNNKEKKAVVETCVRAVEQIYKDLHGEDKLDMCIEYATQMLESKGIIVSEIELRMLIEAAVNRMNEGFNKSEEEKEEAEMLEEAAEGVKELIEEESGE